MHSCGNADNNHDCLTSFARAVVHAMTADTVVVTCLERPTPDVQPLQIRFWLSCAYWLLVVQGALGFPSESQWFSSTGIFAAGVVGFAVLGGLLHTAAYLSLLWDERPIKIRGEDEEQLWRLMYRRSGMNRLEFQACLKLGSYAPVLLTHQTI